jgi:hypothetical protein
VNSKLSVDSSVKDERGGGGGGGWVLANKTPMVGRHTQPLKPARLEHCWIKSSLPTLLINWLGCQSKHSNDLHVRFFWKMKQNVFVVIRT